ncbi:GH25 family lysozyme [Limosilactobacillus caecicola]|uniref:GH25 family lysozyme n=1 Tax=Limosilactobacillus caecicola TaxID=2941332 RepID=UPI00203A3FD0|nr:GH25 family lysozyme [Limosilactobacillus caecicola]
MPKSAKTYSLKTLYTVSATTLTTLLAVGVISTHAVHADTTTDQPTTDTASPSSSAQSATVDSAATTSATTTSAAASTNSTTQVQATMTNAATTTSSQSTTAVTKTSADTLDVASYQGNISTATYQNYASQGIENVVVKLTEGTSYTNPYSTSQVKNAQAAGLNVAVYHYAHFQTAQQAVNEANYFASVANSLGLSKNTLVIADMEDSDVQYSGVASNLQVFFDTLSSLGYTNHAVYTGLYYDEKYNVSSVVGKDRTWIAQYYYDYTATESRVNAKRNAGYGAWQYTNNWNGTSIDGTIDLGLFANYINSGVTKAANLDEFDIDATTGTVNVSGWFADNANEGLDNRYVILVDADNNNAELARQQVSAGTRSDVASAYPDLYGSSTSGFSAQFTMTTALQNAISAGHHITVIFRYTASSDGNSLYNDYNFSDQVLNANVANLDNFTVSGNTITVSGWHAADQALGRSYHYLILYDATTGKELARQLVPTTSRSDVAKAYPGVYNAGQSGFSTTFTINSTVRQALANGDALQIISRYTNDAAGNGDTVDYWFAAQKQSDANEGALDNFNLSDGTLHVSGWHAADRSTYLPYQWIIIYDQTTGQEVARQKVSNVSRQDVANAYPAIANASQSGYSADFKISDYTNLQAALLRGDSLEVIARYSDDATNGEGTKVDYWYSNNAKSFNQSTAASALDTFTITDNQVQVAGWYADDRSAGGTSKYVILYDATTGKELSRQLVTSGDRADVAKAYPKIYGAGQSGFTASFAIDSNTALQTALKNGDQLQVIMRYSDQANGEGTYIQHFFTAQTLTASAGSLDSLTVNQDGSITATGWHAADQSAGRQYHYVILYDATAGKELSRVQQTSTIYRNDVAKVYPYIYNAGKSGFNVTFNSSAVIRQALQAGHQIQIIDRYTDDPAGNGINTVDLWFVARTLK